MHWSLLFDDQCTLCVKLASYLTRFNQNQTLEIISLQSFSNIDLSLHDLQQGIHLVNDDGHFLEGDEAISKLIEIMPQSKPMRWLMQKFFSHKVAVPIYRLMSSIRRHCTKCSCKKR